MQILAIDGFVARCEAKGVEREINLFPLQHEELRPGDFIVTHLGQALQKISAQDALTAWEVYDQMLAASADPTDP